MAPTDQAAGPMRFSPPVCYQLSQAGTSSLLRIHLPPHTASNDLNSPLVPPWTTLVFGRLGAKLPHLLRVSCEQLHPQPQCTSGQVWGFAISFPLILVHCRIRFARCVPSTSYCILQTRSFPATPLQFGLSSPWSG